VITRKNLSLASWKISAKKHSDRSRDGSLFSKTATGRSAKERRRMIEADVVKDNGTLECEKRNRIRL
jgi:hypothetical protein